VITDLRRYKLASCLLIVLLLGACRSLTTPEEAPEPVALKVSLLPFLSYAPLYVAEEEGYFAEHGLEVEFVNVLERGGMSSVALLTQGDVDVAATLSSVALFNAMGKGAEIRIVADKGYLDPEGCAVNALVARRSLVEAGELDGPSQLKGRRIAMSLVSLEAHYVEELLDTVGLTLDDVEVVDVPMPVIPDGLEKATIDLASTGEPWVTRILRAGHGVLWMPAQEVIPDYQFAFVLYGPAFLEDKPDAGNRFMVAYLKAVRQLNQGKTERNLELLADFTGLDVDLIEEACWPAFRDDGQINVQSVLDFQTWATEKGHLDSVVTEAQFWDPSFVEYANKVLGASSE
jgi:NitT/TauT family transport system substrate-binding protein